MNGYTSTTGMSKADEFGGLLVKRIPLLLLAGLLLAVSGAFAGDHMSNAQIQAAMEDHLYHAHIFDHGQVTAKYDDGVAKLDGQVDNIGIKLDAERAARKTKEVSKVLNNIQINTAGVSPEQIIAQARHEILTYYAYTIFDDIKLQVDRDNQVVVSGAVTQPFKHSDISYMLGHIKGVAGLQNDIEVLPTSNFDDELRFRIARAIYRDPFFVRYGDQPNPPIHVIVKNGNVTLDGVVATQLDKVKAETAARFAGTYFALANDLKVEGK